MKKLTAFILALSVALSFAACGGQQIATTQIGDNGTIVDSAKNFNEGNNQIGSINVPTIIEPQVLGILVDLENSTFSEENIEQYCKSCGIEFSSFKDYFVNYTYYGDEYRAKAEELIGDGCTTLIVDIGWTSPYVVDGLADVHPNLGLIVYSSPYFVPWARAGLEDHVIDWRDENLENEIRAAIYRRGDSDDITLRQMWARTELDLGGYSHDENDIRDISALGELTNLDDLYVNGNFIDTKPLENLRHLKRLQLSSENIDINGLSSLTDLEELVMIGCNLDDISFISNFAELKHLTLNHNNIRDITPLSALVELEYVDLGQNDISDLTPLRNLKNLQYLGFRDNNVHDISVLTELTSLANVEVYGNPIEDYSPLDAIDAKRGNPLMSEITIGGK